MAVNDLSEWSIRWSNFFIVSNHKSEIALNIYKVVNVFFIYYKDFSVLF